MTYQETQPKNNSPKEAFKASFFKREVFSQILLTAFANSSSGKTSGEFTVVETPHQIFGVDCQGKFFTVLKTEEGLGEPQNLGSFCDCCNKKINLPFRVNRKTIKQIETQTQFEHDFEEQLKKIIDSLAKK